MLPLLFPSAHSSKDCKRALYSCCWFLGIGTQDFYFIDLICQGQVCLRSLQLYFPLCGEGKSSASVQTFLTSDKSSQCLSVAFSLVLHSRMDIYFSPSLVQQNRHSTKSLGCSSLLSLIRSARPAERNMMVTWLEAL